MLYFFSEICQMPLCTVENLLMLWKGQRFPNRLKTDQMLSRCFASTKGFQTDWKNPAYGSQSICRPMQIVATIQKNPARRFYTLYEQKYSNLKPLLSISFPKGFRKSKKFGDWTLGGGAGLKRLLNIMNTWRKKIWKNYFRRGNFRLFLSKIFQIWDHFFPLIFPKDSKSLKILDIQFWKVGAKRRLNNTMYGMYTNLDSIVLMINDWISLNLQQKKLYFARWFYTLYE